MQGHVKEIIVILTLLNKPSVYNTNIITVMAMDIVIYTT